MIIMAITIIKIIIKCRGRYKIPHNNKHRAPWDIM